MFKKQKPRQSDRIDSLIGLGSTINGDYRFSGGLRVDGTVKGNVFCVDDKAGTLIVSEKARIEGKVTCTHLVLNGEVIGPIAVSQYVELQPKARIRGDLRYKTLEMHPGAIVDGKLVHVKDAETADVPQTAVD